MSSTKEKINILDQRINEIFSINGTTVQVTREWKFENNQEQKDHYALHGEDLPWGSLDPVQVQLDLLFQVAPFVPKGTWSKHQPSNEIKGI